MRIAIICSSSTHLGSDSDDAVYATEIAHALQRKGHVVCLIAETDNVLLEECFIFGVQCSWVPKGSGAKNNLLLEILARLRCDVVHIVGWSMAWICTDFRNSADRRSFLSILMPCPLSIYDSEIQDAVNNALMVIMPTNSLKDRICSIYKISDDRLMKIFPGANIVRFDGWIEPAAVKKIHGIHPHNSLIYIVDGDAALHRAPLVCQALYSVVEKVPTTSVLVGRSNAVSLELWNRTAACAGVTRNLFTESSLKRWQETDIYRACDCVIAPGGDWSNGSPVLNAWSAGKPAVALGCDTELVWHSVNGLCSDDTSESLAEKLISLLIDPPHRQWMGRNGRVAAESAFAWNTVADTLASLYIR